jgi:integrase
MPLLDDETRNHPDVRALLDSTAGAQSKLIAVASREGSLRAGGQFSDVGLALARFSRPIGHTGRDDNVSFVGVEHYFTRLLAYDALTAYVARVAPERSDELEQHLRVIRPFTADEFAYVGWYQSQADKAPFIRRAHAVHDLVRDLPHLPDDDEDRSELGVFLFTAEQYDRDHAALAVLLGLNRRRVSEACATNVEDLGLERGHRTLQIVGKGNKPATIPLVPRTARTIDLAIGERHEARSLADAMASGSIGVQPTAGCAQSASAPGSARCTLTCFGPRSSWPPSTTASRYETCRLPPGTQIRAQRRSTTGDARTSTATPPTSSSPSPAADSRRPLGTPATASARRGRPAPRGFQSCRPRTAARSATPGAQDDVGDGARRRAAGRCAARPRAARP